MKVNAFCVLVLSYINIYVCVIIYSNMGYFEKFIILYIYIDDVRELNLWWI